MRIRRPEEIAAAVREARRSLRLSQTEFAARLEVNREWVSRLENGEPGVALGLVLRALNELGLYLGLESEEAQPAKAGIKAKTKTKALGNRFLSPISIDEIVDGSNTRSIRPPRSCTQSNLTQAFASWRKMESSRSAEEKRFSVESHDHPPGQAVLAEIKGLPAAWAKTL